MSKRSTFSRVIATLLTLALMLSTLSTVTFAAKSETIAASKNLPAYLVSKSDKYITLKNDNFFVDHKIRKILSKNELNLINEAVKSANMGIADTKKQLQGQSSIVTTSTGKSVVFSSYESNTSTSGSDISVKAINPAKYYDYEFCWWGVRIYLSHWLLTNLKSYADTWKYGSVVTGAVVLAILTRLGVGGVIAAVVGGIVTVGGVYAYERIMACDRGMGTYIDVSYFTFYNQGLGIALSNIKSAGSTTT